MLFLVVLGCYNGIFKWEIEALCLPAVVIPFCFVVLLTGLGYVFSVFFFGITLDGFHTALDKLFEVYDGLSCLGISYTLADLGSIIVLSSAVDIT